MATENGEAEVKMEQGDGAVKQENMETDDGVEHSEDYQKLVDYGINVKVASELEKIYTSGILSHTDLDERALDALKEFPGEGGVQVLKQFAESNLEHVTNKSAFLCGVMKTYRTKNKQPGVTGPDANAKKGPDEAKLKEILDRTGYTLDVTTGQRKYGGPPPDWEGTQPGAGHEVFCGKLPKDMFEDEIIPLFEKCGKIWDLRLMMDPMTGLNRSFCFVTYCDKEGAQEAVKQLDNYEVRKGKPTLKCNISVANLRLFVGNIPKSKSKEEIVEEFSKITEGVTDVIIYSSPDDSKKKNRGFAFIEYESHKVASLAKRRLASGRIRVWGCDIIVDWADPIEEPDNDTMSKVKVLYVRNLKSDVTEESLKEKFEPYGKIERVKKIKDYGFVHFEERDPAVKAMEELNGTKIGESEMTISLAKPPSEKKKMEKRRRYEDNWGGYGPPARMGGPPMRGGRMMRGGGGGHGPARGGFRGDYYDYDGFDYGYNDPSYYDDYYGYEDDSFYGGGYGGGYAAPRGGRGGRGAGPGMRGRGGGPNRGGVGMTGRGSRGGSRGMRGGRGARGGVGGGRGRGGGGLAGKRKMGGDYNPGQNKRRNMDGNWGAQPIAQQPLGDSQWYQDSYGSQWS